MEPPGVYVLFLVDKARDDVHLEQLLVFEVAIEADDCVVDELKKLRQEGGPVFRLEVDVEKQFEVSGYIRDILHKKFNMLSMVQYHSKREDGHFPG